MPLKWTKTKKVPDAIYDDERLEQEKRMQRKEPRPDEKDGVWETIDVVWKALEELKADRDWLQRQIDDLKERIRRKHSK